MVDLSFNFFKGQEKKIGEEYAGASLYPLRPFFSLQKKTRCY